MQVRKKKRKKQERTERLKNIEIKELKLDKNDNPSFFLKLSLQICFMNIRILFNKYAQIV